MLLSNFLLFLFLLLDILVVDPRLLEGCDEVIEGSKELVTLCVSGILAEQPADSVKLQINSFY